MEIGRDFNMDYDKRRKRKRHPPFSITDNDRLKHMLVAGKTGLGKSTLLANMIRQDIIAGHGFAVLDPHGTLIDDVLLLIPEKRIKDVILLDFTDLGRRLIKRAARCGWMRAGSRRGSCRRACRSGWRRRGSASAC